MTQTREQVAERERIYRQEHSQQRLAYKRKWRREHPGHEASKAREFRANHPEQAPKRFEQFHKYMLKARYGMTAQQYTDMLKAQGGCCAICKTDRPGRTIKHFIVDHDHETGRVRGLLCQRCNMNLARFGDSRELLLRAAAYLDKT